jgi:hypothetical protein
VVVAECAWLYNRVPNIMAERVPLIAVVGSASDARKNELKIFNGDVARRAAEDIGRELAKAKCRVLIYSSCPDFIEFDVVRGYMAANSSGSNLIQVRYPLNLSQAPFPGQTECEQLFDWRPDRSNDWEVSFYRSLEEVDGIILIGGGSSTLIGGLVAMGHRLPTFALALFGGAAAKVWESLSIQRDLVSPEDVSLMARPKWTPESAKACIASLEGQRNRLKAEAQTRKLLEVRQSGILTKQALLATALFVAAISAVPVAWAGDLSYRSLLFLLFLCPVLSGVSGATIRMIFDWRQGATLYATGSAWVTAALGLIAGGVSGLLFISAQLSAIPQTKDAVVAQLQAAQASRLVPFALAIGFVAGLTLDAVFRKLTGVDVVRTDVVEVKKS